MIQAGFWSSVMYAASYPTLHLYLMREVSDKMISANQILICLAIIVVNNMWNKNSDNLYKFFPVLMLTESITYFVIHAAVIFGYIGAAGYYIIDTILLCLITRNMICGGNKLRSIVYKEEKREKYDNTVMIANSVGTLIGSGIALCFSLPVKVVFVTSWIGISIDNLFYWMAFRKENVNG